MKNVFTLSFIIALRFLGLFIVLPVLSLYALELEYSTTFLVGFVMGGYALTQIVFQIPFGRLSDKVGRKQAVYIGLVIFIIGSIVCAMADDIYTLIIGRLIQGSGAISAVIIAMISDFTIEEKRGKAMAIMGMSIGASFAVSMILGPIIGAKYGLDKLFIVTAVLSFIALILMIAKVENPPTISHSYDTKKINIKSLFKDHKLGRMFLTFFFHSSVVTMAFLIIPIIMNNDFLWDRSELWKIYMFAIGMGILSMPLAVIFGEIRGRGKEVFLISIALIAIGFVIMTQTSSLVLFICGVMSFFLGFNMFEPLLQSFVSKYAKIHQKGLSLSVANTFSYLGAFVGGISGGYILQEFGKESLGFFVLGICVLWFFWILTLKRPASSKNLYLNFDEYNESKLNLLDNKTGIIEYYTNITQKILVIKYEKEIDEKEIINTIR
ncbi:MAG: Putative transport protein [uncultured Campylobacterales bacterium]|uniref:Transport protein n=1 Tax=uncultured Campylobacterales bacterium TaxID=352960 RepID=A0A6S6SWB3_9BACT|nr:MAG: Putative transport protein [uncultured Campylobacterales bacterium]